MGKQDFRFRYNTYQNGERVIPLRYCVNFDGNSNIGLVDVINYRISVGVSKTILHDNGELEIYFNNVLNPSDIALLNSIVAEYTSKISYTQIEQVAITWYNSEFPVRDVLPTIENSLLSIYNNVSFDWNTISWMDKRILAYWGVCTNLEALEVFSQGELDSFRWYRMYKYLDPLITSGLKHNDIYVAPKIYDFTKDFTNLYKKGSPIMSDGRPISVEYFGTYNTTTHVYGDKFARIDFQFVDDQYNLILEKVANLGWTFNDGSDDVLNVKNIGRYYHPVEDMTLRLDEAKLKRENIFTQLKVDIANFINITENLNNLGLAQQQGVQFLDNYDNEFMRWIDLGSLKQAALVSALNLATPLTYPWINNDISAITLVANQTIKDYIIDKISIA